METITLSTRWKQTLFSRIKLLVLIALLFPSVASAVDGVEKTSILVNGKEYTVVVGNTDRRNELYFLKKALNGDKEAREMFLQGNKERVYFIGDDSPVWIKVTEDSESIIKP